MKYKCGDYITRGGWGGYGVYKVSSILDKDADGRDIIEVDGIMAGTGEGWDGEAQLDKDWLQEATKRMNK